MPAQNDDQFLQDIAAIGALANAANNTDLPDVVREVAEAAADRVADRLTADE